MALDAGMAQRRPKKKDPPESELRVPPLPKTAETVNTPTYQTTIGGWSRKPVGANTIRPTDTAQVQKKQIAFDASTPSPVSRSKTWEGGTARAVPDEGVYKSSTTTRTAFTGGGRTFSDPTPKPPESELRISPMPKAKAKIESTPAYRQAKVELDAWAENRDANAFPGSAGYMPDELLYHIRDKYDPQWSQNKDESLYRKLLDEYVYQAEAEKAEKAVERNRTWVESNAKEAAQFLAGLPTMQRSDIDPAIETARKRIAAS